MATNNTHPALPADFSFTFDPSVAAWNHPVATYNQLNNKAWDGLLASAFVFHPVTNRFLLVQRAPHDSGALRWEAPGGAVDREDPTILHGACRELFEEAGLKAKHVKRAVSEGPDAAARYDNMSTAGGFTFTTRRGLVCCGWSFVVEVDLEEIEKGVTLDPNEHVDYVWASEEEIREGRCGEKSIPLVRNVQMSRIMEAFRVRRENGEMAE
ncbi:hypothetical protein NLU13_4594 [Sarocladium strictum]|uniref:Nudix hydrolase domain-containing protein n=1 Tax=Sarocladium strictum TaxID=5046 RepID=A0AA39GJZ1_SARSR|nr:hypothetical protein NLU13_4594 [Sarocladium strictum]